MKYRKDYYQILGVPPNASTTEIRRAYRHLALLHHPDRSPNSQTTALMQEINEAYSVIGNNNKRMRYDFEYINSKSTQANGVNTDKNIRAATDIQEFIKSLTKAFRDAFSSSVVAEAARNVQELIKPFTKALHDAFSSPTILIFLAIFIGTLIASRLLFLELTREPVCASYFQTPYSSESFQGIWTINLVATKSSQACYSWMEDRVSNKPNCAQPVRATSIIIVLIDKSRLSDKLPHDLNYKTEFVSKIECSTQ